MMDQSIGCDEDESRASLRPSRKQEKRGRPPWTVWRSRSFRRFSANASRCLSIEVRARPQKADSAEVYIGDEFIGVVYRDDEDGDLSYNFTMAILDIDLE